MTVICLEGQGELKDSEGNVIALKQGETVLVPASIESVHLYPTEKFKLLTSMV